MKKNNLKTKFKYEYILSNLLFYSILYHKLKCSNAFSNSYFLATIIFVSEKNALITALGLLQIPQIRVTYYL